MKPGSEEWFGETSAELARDARFSSERDRAIIVESALRRVWNDAMEQKAAKISALRLALELLLTNWPAHRDGMDDPIPVGVKQARAALASGKGK